MQPGQPENYAYRLDDVVIGPLKSVYDAEDAANWYDAEVADCIPTKQLGLFFEQSCK